MSVNLCAKTVSKEMRKHPFSCSWFLLPVFLGISSTCGMIVTYILAKKNCHIQQWYLPYISYTGTEMPESTVFGLILNLEGFLGFIVVIIAWRFLRQIGENGILSQATLVCGLISCIGVVMVGNFPVSKLKVPHYIGAGLAFMVGTVYCGLASGLCYKVFHKVKKPRLSSLVCALRITATVIMFISLFTGLFTQFQKQNFKTNYGRLKLKAELGSRTDWHHPNGTCKTVIDKVPYELKILDLVGALSEWLLTSCLLFFLALYAYEFKEFQSVKILLRCDTGEPLNKETWKGRLLQPSVMSGSSTNGTSFTDISLHSKKASCCRCDCHKTSIIFEHSSNNNRSDGEISERSNSPLSTDVSNYINHNVKDENVSALITPDEVP